MRIGYIRVSTQEQNLERQEATMERLQVERVFSDKASGKDAKRGGLEGLLNFIREGDQVIVDSFSRLARNTADLLRIVNVFKEKGVAFTSMKENVDTTTPQGELMLTMFGALYQFERENMLIAQREGIAIAKAKGLYKGRKPCQINFEEFKAVCGKWREGKITAVEAMRRLNMKKNTFYRRVKEFGL